MRKLPITILLLTALLTCSCSERKTDYIIGVSQCSDDEWREKMNMELRREASFYPGVEIIITSAHDDNSQQIKDIDALVAKGVDLLIVAPNEAGAIAPAVDEIYDSGIPVVLVDRKTGSDKYTAYVGADNYRIGYEIGKYVAGRLNGRGKVVELMGLYRSTPGRERHAGFTDALELWHRPMPAGHMHPPRQCSTLSLRQLLTSTSWSPTTTGWL